MEPEILSADARAKLSLQLQRDLENGWRHAEASGDGTLFYDAVARAQEELAGRSIVEGDDWRDLPHPKTFLYRILGNLPSWPGDARYQRMSDWTVEWFYIAVAGIIAYYIWQALVETVTLLIPVLAFAFGIGIGILVISRRRR